MSASFRPFLNSSGQANVEIANQVSRNERASATHDYLPRLRQTFSASYMSLHISARSEGCSFLNVRMHDLSCALDIQNEQNLFVGKLRIPVIILLIA